MKILFVDLLFQHGNLHVDNYMMDIMANNCDVYLLMNEDFLSDKLQNRGRITVLGNPYTKTPNGGALSALQILRRMRLAAKYERELKPDLIYISTYETRVFPLGLKYFRNPRKIVVVENYNIDALCGKVQSYAYKLFAHHVHHLVYEPLFKDYLVEAYNINSDLIHYVPHIQYVKENERDDNLNNSQNQYDCIAISGSNDEGTVCDIIKKEKNEHFFEINRIKCFIKCKGIDFKSNYLTVNGRFIPTEEYEELYSKTKVVLVPFPLSYKYRMSGCIVDAFSHYKPVISSGIELAKYYSAKYGIIIRTTNSVEEMLDAVKELIDNREQYKFDFETFINDHSAFEVERNLMEMINIITKH